MLVTRALVETNSTILNARDKTMLLYRFLFLLKFLSARVPSRPHMRLVILDILTAFASTLISFVWRIQSITGVLAAFLAGI